MIPRWFFFACGLVAGFGAAVAAVVVVLGLASNSGAGWRTRVDAAIAERKGTR